MTVLVGREAELDRLLTALAPAGPRSVVLTAEPGMGKTSVVEAFLEAAGASTMTIWSARPLEAEHVLAFSGLADLLSGIPPTTYDELPGPQRTAIRAALLLEDAAVAVDPRAVAAALRAVVTAEAERGPMVLVIDDAQWLDDETTHALAQSLARLPVLPVCVVAATRPGGRPVSEWLPSWPTERLGLAPLTAAALFHVVREHLGQALDRGSLRAVETASGGNPLHALEYARHRVSPEASTFEQLLEQRLLALPRPTRLALLAAALAGAPSVDLVAQVRRCTPSELLDLLEPAVLGRLVRVTDRVSFAHPLYAEAVISSSPPSDRRECHVRLAAAEPGLEARARHLGIAATSPDHELAKTLEDAAQLARRRGAWDSAAELMALAVERTPVGSPAWGRRALARGDWLVSTGRPAEAEKCFVAVRSAGAATSAYWSATIQLAQLLMYLGRIEESVPLAAELRAVELPLGLRAQAVLSVFVEELNESPAEQLALVAAVNRDLRGLPAREAPPGLRASGLTLEAWLRSRGGERADGLLEEAVALEELEPARTIADSAALTMAHQATLAHHHDEARTRFEHLVTACRERGDDFSIPLVHTQFAFLEQRAGRWDRALELLAEGRRSAEGQHQLYLWLVDAGIGSLQGQRGDYDGALAALLPLVPAMESLRDPGFEAIIWNLIGQLHLTHGHPDEAYAALTKSRRRAEAAHWRDPGDLQVDYHVASAALALGRLDEVERCLEDVEERARAMDRQAVLIDCAWLRVMLTAARGDLDAAVAAVPAALAAYDAGPCQPLRRGQAYLGAGQVYRRAKAKRLAAEMLEVAIGVFEEIGCPPYAARARSELARVGLRPRADEGLTETERQVARLAAEGLRNLDIADRVFTSPKTVEAILTRCYRKLGIRSRAGLARALDAVD